ncbi:hypothetical protein HHI36_019505 [Cryptolaemus montrouzieri]|uniref:ABC-type xenobiotic transporter n=1 Tax=Cryptolaemus montrouzieri TaxID=559131 RepID=A0ABD2P3Y3_9CUCU
MVMNFGFLFHNRMKYIVNSSIKEELKIEKEKEDSIPYWKLFRYATLLDWTYIFIGVICTIITGGCMPFFFTLFGQATDDIISYVTATENANLTDSATIVLEEKLYSDISIFSIKSICLAMLTLLFQYMAGVLFSYSSLRQVFKIRQKFLESTLYNDITWFDMNKTGDFTTGFSENLGKIEEGIGEKVGVLLIMETMFVIGIVWSFLLGWKLTLVCLVSSPVVAVVMAILTWVSTKFTKREMDSYSQAGCIAEEVLSSIRTVVAYNGQNKEVERYTVHLEDAKKNNIRTSIFTAIATALQWFLVYASCAPSLWYGVKLIIQERDLPAEDITYTPGVVVTIFFNTLLASWNFVSGGPYLQTCAEACGAANKIFQVLDCRPKINVSLKLGIKLNNVKGEIVFRNIRFRYPSRPDVKILNGLSFTIKPGETVAFVGNSGSGKSTCIQLVQRFYDPDSGEILIDGREMKELNLRWLRSKIGVVGQEPALFATTIAENIRYGKSSATQEEIERAAEKAKIHKFIKSLPNSYDSVIGERGTQLSGGQKQRIAIARALIREPSILLLDEATSALDTTSEAEVQSALDSVTGQCTTIIVAHRLSTVRNADRIFVLHEGQIVEDGSYQELISKKGVFFDLVKFQRTSDEKTTTSDAEIEYFKGDSITETDGTESYMKMSEFVRIQNNEEKKRGTMNVLLDILKMNKPEWIYILIGCLASFIVSAGLPVYSLLFGDIIGIFSNENVDELREATESICIFFIVLGFVTGLGYLIQIYAFGVAGENLTFRVRNLMFSTMLKQEMGWFDRKDNGIGALCSKLSNEAASIQAASGMPLGTLLNSLSTLLIANVLALYYQWKLALVMLAIFPFVLVSIYYEQKVQQGNSDYRQRKLQKSARIAVEAIGNIRTVVSLGCEKIFLTQYTDELLPYIVSAKRKSHSRSFIMGLAKSLMFVAYAIGLFYGCKLIIDENINYGIIFKVAEIAIAGSWAIGNTFAFAPNFKNGLEAATRMFAFLKRSPEIQNVSNASKDRWEMGNIQCSSIHFSYPTRPELPVLKGLDLSVLAGKTVALVGSSGCGKSTIIQLLERFYNSSSGHIRVDGTDIVTMDLDHIRAHFGIVSQEPNLFDRTISENIAYGDNQRNISMNEIVEAAKKANIHNFVASLPQGYETRVGAKGTQLSGGQKQRIAIARALIRNPRVLLLDEATSALDNESEKIVQEALDEAKEGRTCITIAHRLTTVQDADVICVIDKGKVVEMGKHHELLERKGHYFTFYNLQNKPKNVK